MAISPAYVGTPKSSTVSVSTANSNRNGVTGAYGTIHTAGASGSRIDALSIAATGTTTAGMIRLFINAAMIKEIPVIAITPSATQPAWNVDITFEPALVLAASAILKANTHNYETFNLTVTNGGDF